MKYFIIHIDIMHEHQASIDIVIVGWLNQYVQYMMTLEMSMKCFIIHIDIMHEHDSSLNVYRYCWLDEYVQYMMTLESIWNCYGAEATKLISYILIVNVTRFVILTLNILGQCLYNDGIWDYSLWIFSVTASQTQIHRLLLFIALLGCMVVFHSIFTIWDGLPLP